MSALNLTDLRYFLLLADELHFGRTAERIGVAQPILTRRILRLEQTVGAKLLERTSRNVALTAKGRRLRDDGAAALEALDQAVAGVKDDVAAGKQVLRVGFFAAAEPILPKLAEQWRTKLECVVELHHLSSVQQVRHLRDGTLDLGFIRPPVHRGYLDFTVLFKERVVCVLPKSHRLAGLPRLRLGDLQGERLVRLSPMIGTSYQRQIESELRRRKFSVTIGQLVQSTHSVQALVAMSEGIALLPAYVADAPRPGLTYLEVDDLPVLIPLAIARQAGEGNQLVMRAMTLAIAAVNPSDRLGAISQVHHRRARSKA